MTDTTAPPKDAKPDGPYRVLARKYRPQTFEELIGQGAMVRTLRNAIDSKRLAHAFIMTGVRGVGKTTTARLIARALNCVGPDGTGNETITPCGVCDFCTSIAAGRHPDVIEMDAASNTGVDDVRAIIDNVPYAAASARYKIYIIDEVHMLSRNAFNALLKTLEEPPAHVKFIFATTEIRKVPVTVLSRCQRFDLKRIDVDDLQTHFEKVCAAEEVTAEPEALALVAQAAQGSVRDGLSLLDQAIAHAGDSVTQTGVREMLGLSEAGAGLALLEHVLAGQAEAALGQFDQMYKDGADPATLIEELLGHVHALTRLRVAPPREPAGGALGALAQKMPVSALSTAWQILLKGLPEVKAAPQPRPAAEMVLIRLAYAASLPSPEQLMKILNDGAAGMPGATGPVATGQASTDQAPPNQAGTNQAAAASGAQSSAANAPESGRQRSQADAVTSSHASSHTSLKADAQVADQASGPALAAANTQLSSHVAEPGGPNLGVVQHTDAPLAQTKMAPAEPGQPSPSSRAQNGPTAARNLQLVPHSDAPFLPDFAAVAQLCDDKLEGILAHDLRTKVRPVRFDPDARQIVLQLMGGQSDRLFQALRAFMQRETGAAWHIETAQDGGGATLAETQSAAQQAAFDRALQDPAVKRALELFPKAKVVKVRKLETMPALPPTPQDGGPADLISQELVPDDAPLPMAPDGYEVLPDSAYDDGQWGTGDDATGPMTDPDDPGH